MRGGSAGRTYEFCFSLQDNFLSTNLFISGSWCASISKALLFPSHHIFHTLKQNKRCTFAGVHIFCTIFCSSSIVSSLARVNLSWFNAAIFSHLRKRFSKFFFSQFSWLSSESESCNFIMYIIMVKTHWWIWAIHSEQSIIVK